MSWKVRAKRLPRQPGPAAWNRLLPDPPPPDTLKGDTAADIAIIGAGFAGLSAARRLNQIDPEIHVAVLDAGRLAEGPAGRNSGFMIDLPHDLSASGYVGGDQERERLETRLNRAAIRFAATAATDLRMSSETFNQCGKINAAATRAGDQLNRDYAQHLENAREPYRMLDASEMASVTGSSMYVSGLYTPGTAMLQPAAYIRSLAAGLSAQVNVYETSPVTEIMKRSDGWNLLTPRGTVSASKVILANNGHAESFGFFRRRLMHVFTYASMTELFPNHALEGESNWALTPADAMGTTVRRISGIDGSRIVMRSRFTYNPTMFVSGAAIARAGALHDQKFNDRFPALSNISMEYRWAGHLCLSLNGVPAHGEIEPGLFSAVCQNGLGTAKGTLAGISAAELATDTVTEISRALTTMAPPRRLPPEPLSWLGVNALMKWKEWRAGNE